MAWCHQATSHYLSQCWPRSLSPYDVTRPQWINQVSQWYFGKSCKQKVVWRLTCICILWFIELYYVLYFRVIHTWLPHVFHRFVCQIFLWYAQVLCTFIIHKASLDSFQSCDDITVLWCGYLVIGCCSGELFLSSTCFVVILCNRYHIFFLTCCLELLFILWMV